MQKLIYGIGATLLLLIVIGFLLPRTHEIDVHIEIDAHSATVFALVNDPERFAAWAPWVETDPNARMLYTGPKRGVGATISWDGVIIGSGTQTIVENEPYRYVAYALSPGEPSESLSWFRLEPGVGTTIVTWGFKTDYGMNIIGRYFASVLGGVVARDYQDGLVRLKDLAESLPGADFADLEVEQIAIAPVDIAYLSTRSNPDPAEIASALGKAYFQILAFIDTNRLASDGAPLSIAREFTGSALAFDAAIPVRGLTDETRRGGPGVKIGATYGGPVIRAKHRGSYASLTSTHRKIAAYLAALGIERNGSAWESYVSDPGNTPETDLLTYLYYPIRLD